MRSNDVSRRDVLRSVAAGSIGAASLGGVASAEKPERHIVGTASPAARREAERAAESVHRKLDFGDVGQAVAGVFPEGRRDALRKRSDVRYVEEDRTWQALHHKDGHEGGPGGGDEPDQTLPWGIDRIDAEVAHDDGETGADADVAIIDTGIDDDHPDLQANVGAGKAWVKCRGKNCNYPWSDDNDHGTHCAGIAAAVDDTIGVVGVATEATLHALKVLDSRGSGYYSDIAAAIEYTADQGWDVASMSLGGGSGSEVIEDACQYAYDKGVLLVAAAGNSGPCSDCVGYPAAYDQVVAVSATTQTDELASFSSTGPQIELAAPGEAIFSTVIGDYDTFSGTSMACPHVSGTGAHLMANDDTNEQARQTMRDTAEDIGLDGVEQGAGLVDAAAALGLDSSDDLSDALLSTADAD